MPTPITTLLIRASVVSYPRYKRNAKSKVIIITKEEQRWSQYTQNGWFDSGETDNIAKNGQFNIGCYTPKFLRTLNKQNGNFVIEVTGIFS